MPFTSDVHVLEAGIGRVDAIGGTAMRDAIDLAQAYLGEHGTRDRKVLLVITDGIDNASVAARDRIEKAGGRARYGHFCRGSVRRRGPGPAGAPRTGSARRAHRGMAYYPATIDEIGAVALEIAQQIRNQYTIAYAPLNQALDGTYRTLRVTVSGPGGLSVRSRDGYRASP